MSPRAQSSLFDFGGIEVVPEKPEDILRQIMGKPCLNCRLGPLHPHNHGFMYRGDLQAKVAVVGEAPGDHETKQNVPLVGNSGQEWEKWAAHLGLDTRHGCFVSYVCQCQPPKIQEKGKGGKNVWKQREPKDDELALCFPERCLRVLRSLPNLELLICLGFTAAAAFLGGDPKLKTHAGQYFRTELLPGVAVFVLPHPSYLLHDPTPEKSGSVAQMLDCLKREYFESRKVLELMKG